MESDKIFFSYSRTDGDFALKLAKDLRGAGVKIWLDQLDIKPGSHWDLSIESALTSAQILIVILSPESVASNNVMDEVSFALEAGKIVIPIVLADCIPPFRLKRLQRVDFTGDYQTGLNKLLEYLGEKSGSNVNKEVILEKEKSKNAETSENPKLDINKGSKDKELENLTWEKAKKQDNLTAYIHYIDDYPNGKYKDEALSKLTILRERKQETKIPIIQSAEKSNFKKYSFIGGGVLILAFAIIWVIIKVNQTAIIQETGISEAAQVQKEADPIIDVLENQEVGIPKAGSVEKETDPIFDVVESQEAGTSESAKVEKVTDQIFEKVEIQPNPPGGNLGWTEYLSKNLIYPTPARRMGIEGIVIVSFVVNIDGSIQDVEVFRGIGGGCDEEALRVVSASPKWEPGKQRGRPVRTRMRLPIRFKFS